MSSLVMDARELCRPLSRDDLFDAFELPYSTSKHLLILYSLVVGLRAKVIVDLGLGMTTGAIRGAAQKTGGVVYTCDSDRRRFEELLNQQDEHWRLHLELSETFIPKVPHPIDFVMHDGSHIYQNVRRDLELLLPRMRRFGLICVHDTQQPDLCHDMLGAIRDATAQARVSVTNLPFGAGLAVIRVEESVYPSIDPEATMMNDGRSDTLLTPSAWTYSQDHGPQLSTRSFATRWAHARDRIGHILRQGGIRG